MSTQVVRVARYNKGSLNTIGRECDRADVNHRNEDIDKKLSCLNQSYKDAPDGFRAEYERVKKNLNATERVAKNVVAFEGMVITSDTAFFEKLGWSKGKPAPEAVTEFFDKSYEFAKQQIGFHGSDANIISAKVHYDETTPHMHVYFVPVTDVWQEKVYQRDSVGHVVRNEKGVPQQARGEDGKCLYRQVRNQQAPRISKSEFWRARGGSLSYRRMQDAFQEQVARLYGLERGNVGSDREYRTKSQWERSQLDAEKNKLTAEIEPYRKMQTSIEKVELPGKTILPGVVAVKKKNLDELREQAKAYTANKNEILTVRNRIKHIRVREQEVDRREQEVQEGEKAVQKRENIAASMIEKQRNLNDVNAGLEQQIKKLDAEIQKQRIEIGDLERRNDALRGDMGRVKLEAGKDINELSERLTEALEGMSDIVKAVGMLKWDREGVYKVSNLNVEQSRLIDAVGNVGKSLAQKNGLLEIAEGMSKYIGVLNSVQQEVEKLTPKRHIHHEYMGPEL